MGEAFFTTHLATQDHMKVKKKKRLGKGVLRSHFPSSYKILFILTESKLYASYRSVLDYQECLRSLEDPPCHVLPFDQWHLFAQVVQLLLLVQRVQGNPAGLELENRISITITHNKYLAFSVSDLV